MKIQRAAYYSKTELRNRKWTETAIRKFLGSADRYIENPVFSWAAPKRLYSVVRVHQIEDSHEYREWRKRNDPKRVGAFKAVKTKQARLIEEINESMLESLETEITDLLNSAINALKANPLELRRAYHGHNYDIAISDQEIKKYLIVRYLRHETICNECYSKWLYGRIGKGKAYSKLNEIVCDKIAILFPYLARAAENQKEEKVNCRRDSYVK